MPAKPGGAVQGTFPSLKLNRPVRYTSTVERDLLFVLEYEQQISRYQEQPFQIQMEIDNNLHNYIPDYAIWVVDGRVLVECKPEAQLDDPHTQQQIRIGTRWSAMNDWQFVIITDTDLRQGLRLANLKLLWRYSRLPISVTTCQHYQQLCNREMTVMELAQSPAGVPVVLHLLFHHYLQSDLLQPLTPQSRVWC